MTNTERAEQQRLLREIAMYLEGLKQGKGDRLPIKEKHLDALWAEIQTLDAR